MTAKNHSRRGLGVRSVDDKPRFEGLEERILLSAWIAQSEGTDDHSGEGRTITADLRAAEVAAWREIVGPVLSTGLIHVREQIEDRIAQGMHGGLAELSTPIVRIDDAGAIQVYVHVEEVSEGAVAALEAAGLDVEAPCPTMRLVQGWVSYASLDDLAAVGGVRSITLPSYAVTRTGSVNTDGDAILKAEDVRSRFDALGIDGSGITVGVISDGIEHAANVQATGDLPEEIATDEEHEGSGDEGTAMLEIIHDLAPGADLAFYAVGSSSEMDDALDFLIGDAGADVVVDDIGFFGEPMFEDGAVADAVAAAVAEDGIVYVSAAGNHAQQHYQGQWSTGIYGYHDFDPDPGVNDDFLDVYVAPNDTLVAVLQWSDPWGGSGNDYNVEVELYPTYEPVSSGGRSVQDGNDDPFELAWWENEDEEYWVHVGISIWQEGGGVQDRELELYLYTVGDTVPGDDDGIVVADDDRTPADSIFGHPAVESVIAAGAIDAADDGHDTIEGFSSQGKSTIYTDFDEQTSEERESLDGAGIDKVETKVGDLGYFDDPFAGTSAAGPHVAALAALVLDVDDTLTPAQVASALNTTAADLTAYGTGYDDVSGNGRFDALGAVYKVFTPDEPDLDAGSDTGAESDDNITNDTTPEFTGTVPEGSFVRLYVDGEEEGTQQLGTGVSSYSITTGTLAQGVDREVTIRVAESSSIPTENLSQPSDPLLVTIDTTAPTADTWYIAAEHAYGVGEALLEIPDDGTFSEPRIMDEAESSELQVEFSEAIDPAGWWVQIAGNDSNSDPVDLSDITIETSTAAEDTVGVIEFTPPLYDLVRYLVQIEDVTDVAGNALAGDNNRIFTAIAGDANGSLRVDAIDLSYIWAHRVYRVDPESEEEVRSDVNRSGRVDSIDLSAAWARRESNMQGVEDPVLDGEGGRGMSLPGQGPEGQQEANSAEGEISIDKYLIDTDLDGQADFFDYDGLLRDLGVSLLGE